MPDDPPISTYLTNYKRRFKIETRHCFELLTPEIMKSFGCNDNKITKENKENFTF